MTIAEHAASLEVINCLFVSTLMALGQPADISHSFGITGRPAGWLYLAEGELDGWLNLIRIGRYGAQWAIFAIFAAFQNPDFIQILDCPKN